MTLDERFDEAYAALVRMKSELLDARQAAREESIEWGGWSVRFNQRMRFERSRLGIFLEPPEGADPRMRPLYDAADALRALWWEMDRAARGLATSDVAAARVGLERSLHVARDMVAAHRDSAGADER